MNIKSVPYKSHLYCAYITFLDLERCTALKVRGWGFHEKPTYRDAALSTQLNEGNVTHAPTLL
jgi:hypothetical protein